MEPSENENGLSQSNIEDESNNPLNQSEENHQVIFEQTFDSLMNKFGEQCKQHNVDCAIAIAKHPNYDEPMVFYRAQHIVDAACLMAQILRQIKSELYNDLNTDEPSEG